ncbi:chemotaxis protein CheC [Methanomicrobiaceae archaeon CYW5]|uniref:chemotaxis protein CheC n=1 Tax=Methanovulcanius yangii TaxID=1789227 RepID=UPI0029CA60BC|nr:chemotaxis protein CheC [Methanovulcanius yangii]MBT8507299.1 chemotaxis protein CheC [Methanovulcanius yangii]
MDLNEQQLDALKEMGNIGASHAATSLSQMLMNEITMTVPKVTKIDIADIAGYFGEEICAMVVFEIQGTIEPAGYIVYHVPKKSAIRMTNAMIGLQDEDREFNEMDESALIEIGNIMVSHFLDATAELLGIVMLPSPPALAIDMAHASFENIVAQVALDINEILLFSTELQESENDIQSTIVLLPEEKTLTYILTLLDNLLQQVP